MCVWGQSHVPLLNGPEIQDDLLEVVVSSRYDR